MQNKGTHKRVSGKILCPDCGMPRGKKGSMTSWLFAEDFCSCWQLQLLDTPAKLEPVAPASAISDVLLPVDLLGANYEVRELIGRGGMGAVFKVYDRVLDLNLAVKVLSPDLATNKESLKRFMQEAKTVAQLTHPNVVAIYGHGVAQNGSPYLLMDFIEGLNLRELLDKEVYLTARRAMPIFTQIAEALAHAHEKGVIHRDLKPANIIISKSEKSLDLVRLVDFGIAKMTTDRSRLAQDLTQASEVLGTPLYMSPEQCLGFSLDGRSDIYALGCLMCETLTGRPPFDGANPMQIIAKHLNESAPELRAKLTRLDVPEHLQNVICACLAKNPQDRYQNAKDLINDLNLISAGKRPSVAGSSVSTSFRSPLFALALDLLPYSVPLIIFTLDSFLTFSSRRRIATNCLWGAMAAVGLCAYYILKVYHLKAVSSPLAQRSSYNIQRTTAYIVTAAGAATFAVTQVIVYLQFATAMMHVRVYAVHYKAPLYFGLLWLVLAVAPFIAASLKKHSHDRNEGTLINSLQPDQRG